MTSSHLLYSLRTSCCSGDRGVVALEGGIKGRGRAVGHGHNARPGASGEDEAAAALTRRAGCRNYPQPPRRFGSPKLFEIGGRTHHYPLRSFCLLPYKVRAIGNESLVIRAPQRRNVARHRFADGPTVVPSTSSEIYE